MGIRVIITAMLTCLLGLALACGQIRTIHHPYVPFSKHPDSIHTLETGVRLCLLPVQDRRVLNSLDLQLDLEPAELRRLVVYEPLNPMAWLLDEPLAAYVEKALLTDFERYCSGLARFCPLPAGSTKGVEFEYRLQVKVEYALEEVSIRAWSVPRSSRAVLTFLLTDLNDEVIAEGSVEAQGERLLKEVLPKALNKLERKVLKAVVDYKSLTLQRRITWLKEI